MHRRLWHKNAFLTRLSPFVHPSPKLCYKWNRALCSVGLPVWVRALWLWLSGKHWIRAIRSKIKSWLHMVLALQLSASLFPSLRLFFFFFCLPKGHAHFSSTFLTEIWEKINKIINGEALNVFHVLHTRINIIMSMLAIMSKHFDNLLLVYR